MKFSHHTMQKILHVLENALKENSSISFDVLNPDIENRYAGYQIEINDTTYIHRSYKAWADLAELLFCRMFTPKESDYPCVTIRFEKLKSNDSFHLDTDVPKEEKYGVNSQFFQINKMEEPAFVYYYRQALLNVHLSKRSSILNLGINTGDEFQIMKNILDAETFGNMQLTGIDHSNTAISHAQSIFPEENVTFYAHDINELERLNLGRFAV